MTDTSAHPGTPVVPGWLAGLQQRQELSAEWAAVIADFPRSTVLPELIWPLTEDGYLTVDREQDPRAWAHWADEDVPIVTQWDDGRHTGRDPGEMATSSASQPALVAHMLTDLDVCPGQRILDVGAGTGWTTGLLSRRACAGHVVGVEVDPGIADAASARLRDAGMEALVVTGDGDKGWPAGAPYDRVQATFAVREVPLAWVEQTRPGGLIVAPWGTRWTNTAAVVPLRTTGDATALGWFTRPVEFMLDRGQRGTWPVYEEYLPGKDWPADTRESTTTLQRNDLADAAFFVGLRVPAAVHTSTVNDDGSTTLIVYGLTDRSWATVFYGDGSKDVTVYQGGPRDLWREVEAAYRWWQKLGEPDLTRFGLTVTHYGQHVFMDTPSNIISSPAR